MSNSLPTLTRRDFVSGGAAVLLLAATAKAGAGKPAAVAESILNVWLRIAYDDTVTIVMSQSEMGQGVSTTLPAALADELGADWSKVKTEWAAFDPAFRIPQYEWMFTGNSESCSTFYMVMRTMGAAAREMLVDAAAARLEVPAQQLSVANSVIVDRQSGKFVRFGQIAWAAAQRPRPTAPRLKPDTELKLVGHRVQRLDIPAKVDGSAIFGIDVVVPEMAIAVIRRAPSPGGRLVSYERSIASLPGVLGVVEITSGLAVIAERFWTARRALEAAQPVFEAGPLAGYSTAGQRADYSRLMEEGPFELKKKVGDAAAVLNQFAPVLEAVYEIQAQAHATMEPMNCTAHVTDTRCEIWAPTQGMEVSFAVAKDATGLPDSAIQIHRTYLGGGFGRRLLADFVRIAIEVAKAAKRPVKTIWTREEDFRYDAFRAPMAHRIRAALGPDGLPRAMIHRVISPSHMLYIFPRTAMKAPRPWDRPIAPPHDYDGMAVEGVLEPPYEIENYFVEQHYVDSPLTVSVWRTTGHGPNNFALESFIDKLANSARRDPLDYRLALAQGDSRAHAVLKAVADMCSWHGGPPSGRARGMALARAFNGYIAQVAEIEVSGSKIRVHRVWSAVDCGRVLDPGIAASNIEGGVCWGLSGLRTQVTFASGEPDQVNFDKFDPLHLWETPQIETRFIESGAQLGGTGELGPVPTHAAVCNAIFAATGKWIHSLPLSRHGFAIG